MPRIIMKDLNFIICFIFFYHPIWDGGASSNRPSAIQERAQSGEARGTGVPWAERAEWFLPRLWQSTFILCFWKNKVLFTFHLARYFFQTLFVFSRLQAEVQTAVILCGLLMIDEIVFRFHSWFLPSLFGLEGIGTMSRRKVWNIFYGLNSTPMPNNGIWR